jgi:hypothetical protein
MLPGAIRRVPQAARHRAESARRMAGDHVEQAAIVDASTSWATRAITGRASARFTSIDVIEVDVAGIDSASTCSASPERRIAPDTVEPSADALADDRPSTCDGDAGGET